MKGGVSMPKVTKEFDKVAYNRQYNEKNYFRVNLTLPIDFKDQFDAAVKSAGVSKNAFIKAAILEKIERGD